MGKVRYLPLTKRETEVFVYIMGYILDNDYSPTRQEIADRFKFSVTASQKFIDSLKDKGRIKIIKQSGKRINRNIVLKEQKFT